MKKILKNKKGFSLIELMIVIVIIGLMLMLSYAPYNLYQSKAKLRVATREVAQSIYEAKNMAVSGVSLKDNSGEKQNKIVGIYLSKEDSKKNNIYYYIDDFGPYQTKSGGFKDENNDEQFEKSEVNNFLNSNNFKTKNMQQNIWFQEFSNSDKTLNFDEILIIFAASSGETKIFGKNGGTWNEVSSDSIKINMNFGGSTSEILKKEITYYTKTNIIDYK